MKKGIKSMEMDELIKEINALAHKKKKEGLTAEEQIRQDHLRQQYLAIFRGNFKSQLEHTKIKTPDGKLHPLKYMPSDKKPH
ncbi:DUF896 domain-containing protein [Cellulosilyticum sp. ST5]|uniref:UPF0291 protein Clole_2382 n=1 Tax=Cellulosilyticum lentocellum (strain ATCC 49066 / DSM 5427 / NCIMB 11756 / RHM5) TaxID=642492 RepID=F2JSW8_CELLD|nr:MULTISPECIES: DUF896 domain-containing protein [Cellulosilyticum]ADZ84089.1 protein of unknown function DUF896 [Cellulosilyticum lentocellum DSM 5427]